MAEKPILLPCPTCAKNVSSDAPECPHCGQPLSDQWEQEGRAKQGKSKKRLEIGCGLVFWLVVIAVGIGYCSQPKTPEERRAANCTGKGSEKAIGWAIVEAREKLRSPKTAEFGIATSRWMGDCNANVYGTVDAQNGFGAMIRSSYTAKMIYRPDQDVWEMLEFTMN